MDLSAEEGFAVCTGFFSALFPTIKSPNETERCFCLVVCDGKRGFAEWSEALSVASGISREAQRSAVFTATQIFDASLAFCRHYDNTFSFELDNLVQLVQSETPTVKDLFKKMLEKAPGRVLAISFDWKSEKNDKLSVEQGYTLSRSFFLDLWPKIAPSLKGDAYDAHDLFCMNICLEGESFAEWNDAVFRAAKLPKEAQRKAFLTDDELFSSFIEFCRIFDEKYDGELKFLVDLLKGMKEAPKEFQWEWNLLNKLKAKVLAGCIEGPFINCDRRPEQLGGFYDSSKLHLK